MEKYCFVLFGILLVAALLSTPGIREGANGKAPGTNRRRREEEERQRKEEQARVEAENKKKREEKAANKKKKDDEKKAKEESEKAAREEDRKTRNEVRGRTSQQRTRADAAKEDEKKAREEVAKTLNKTMNEMKAINERNQDEWGSFAYINAPKDAPKNAPKDAPKNAPKDAPKGAPKNAPKGAPKDDKKDNAQPAKANSQGKGPIPAEALETAGRSWLTGAPMDYIGGDIGSLKTEYTLYQCQEDCVRDKNCRGIVTDFALGNGPGTCQLKSNMGDPKPDASKFPFFYSKYQLPAS